MLSLASMPVPKEYSFLEAFFLDHEIWNTIKPRNEYSDKKKLDPHRMIHYLESILLTRVERLLYARICIR